MLVSLAACLVPVLLFHRPSLSIQFGNFSETNRPHDPKWTDCEKKGSSPYSGTMINKAPTHVCYKGACLYWVLFHKFQYYWGEEKNIVCYTGVFVV